MCVAIVGASVPKHFTKTKEIRVYQMVFRFDGFRYVYNDKEVLMQKAR